MSIVQELDDSSSTFHNVQVYRKRSVPEQCALPRLVSKDYTLLICAGARATEAAFWKAQPSS